MKKELIICLFIFILIIIGNIVTQNYTEKCVSSMNEKLEQLKETSMKVKTGEKNEYIGNKIKEVEDLWNEFKEKLAYYIEHDELEKVETQIFAMNGFEEIEKYDEIIPELEKCVFILEHIQDKTKINIKNIF